MSIAGQFDTVVNAIRRGSQLAALFRQMPMRVQYPNELLSSVAPKYQRVQSDGRCHEHPAMTLAQASYLMTLCEETHEVLDDSLTQAEAALRIAELEEATGRGHRSSNG